MDNMEQTNPDPQKLVIEWMRAANQFWAKQTQENVGSQEKKDKGRALQDSLLSIMRSLGAVSSAMGEPTAMNAIFRSLTSLPDISGNILNSGTKAFLSFYQQAMEKAGRMGESSKPYSFDNLDYETIRAWSDLYKN
jgi:hypothetical protein